MLRRMMVRRGDNGCPTRTRSARPTVEFLEDRQLLSTLEGGNWTYTNRITYSFMPDGTNLGGMSSNLFQTMNAVAPTATWQQAIAKAAATWQAATGINLALVSDNGQAFGTGPNQQGDPNVGDIRIGAFPEQAGVLAFSMLPPPINGGSDAGDILFNSTAAWQVNGNYDLQTVALHEFGHALGLGHSTVTTASMYASYTAVRQALDPDDVGGIQSLDGKPPGNSTTNSTSSTALDLTPLIVNNQIASGGRYTAGVADYNWYKVTVPAGYSGPMTVTMQSTGLSSLCPRLAVYDSGLHGLSQTAAANVYGATLAPTVSSVSGGQVYYFRCSAANTGPGTNGAYGIEVNFGTGTQAPVAPPNTTVAAKPDQGGGSANETVEVGIASLLGVPLPGNVGLVRVGNLVVPGDALRVRVRAATTPPRADGAGPAALDYAGSLPVNATTQSSENVFQGWPTGRSDWSFRSSTAARSGAGRPIG